MTNQKTDDKSKKNTSLNHPASSSDIAAAALEGQTIASTTMIEACDRLAQKLDEVADLIREQTQAWQQIREPAAPDNSRRENPTNTAIDAQVMERVPLREQAPRK